MTPFAAVALGDCLAAAADDLAVVLSSRDARRLAARALEHLAVAGYELTRSDDDR